jgi:integrase
MASLGQNVMIDTHKGRTIFAEANPGHLLKGDLEQMAKRRHQQPKPVKQGNYWWVWIRDNVFTEGRVQRKTQRIKIGPAEMSFRAAQKEVDRILGPLNHGTCGGATLFSHYVEEYRKANMPTLAGWNTDPKKCVSTVARYESTIRKYLLPAFANTMLRDMSYGLLQRYFAQFAGGGLSHASIETIRSVLASIMTAARKMGLIDKNPVDDISLPRDNRGRKVKPWLHPNQFQTLLTTISEPYQTMVYVALHTGLRFSELAALKWDDIDRENCRLTIDERYCRGDWSAPKSEASNTSVPVNRSVIARIDAMKNMEVAINWGANGAKKSIKVVRADGPNDLVFASLVSGSPMREGNILRRHIKPAADALGVKVNWQILRRSFATWLKLEGADVKDAQALLRHARVQTTLDIYQQFTPESQRRVVERLGSRMVN